jgi:phosphoribosylformylglycinamidine (FGAM) synthase-like enzyme
VRTVPRGWRPGDVVLLAEAPGDDLAAEAALVEFLWRSVPRLSLAHDVSEGGLEAALAEAAIFSGTGLDGAPTRVAPHGAVVVACAREERDRLGGVALTELGVAGGETVLGRALEELRAEWGEL